MGVPPNHPFYDWMFHYKPSSYWASSISNLCFRCDQNWRAPLLKSEKHRRTDHLEVAGESGRNQISPSLHQHLSTSINIYQHLSTSINIYQPHQGLIAQMDRKFQWHMTHYPDPAETSKKSWGFPWTHLAYANLGDHPIRSHNSYPTKSHYSNTP